jgi:hypothetical protein
MAQGDCCEQPPEWWCTRPVDLVRVDELSRTVDWDDNFYPAMADALLSYPNKLPLRVCIENGVPELIDGKHRLGAARKRGQFFILAYIHNHDRES